MTARFDEDEDFTLADEPRPRSRARRKSGGNRGSASRRWAWLGFLARRPARTVATATVAALLVGIVVNALALQKGKHPAPLFVPVEPSKPQGVAQVRPAVVAPARSAPEFAPVVSKQKDAIGALLKPNVAQKTANEAALAPAKPKDAIASLIKANGADTLHVEGVPAEAKPKDSIAALLKTDGAAAAKAPERPTEAVAAAQRALVKLGFVLRADGVLGAATRQAIALFERDHGMPADGDLTPRVRKQLSASSGIVIP